MPLKTPFSADPADPVWIQVLDRVLALLLWLGIIFCLMALAVIAIGLATGFISF